MRIRDLPADAQRLRPNRSLFWQGVAAILGFLVPVSCALYFLSVPDGPWPIVLYSQIVVLVLFGLTVISYRSTGFWVSRDGVAERGFFGVWTYVPAEEIGTILFANTYRGSGSDTACQLFICDHDGKQLLRMRGQFWSVEKMRIVSETLDIPMTELGESVSKSELLDRYPGLLYWFERHPLVIGGLVTAAVVVAAALLQLVVVFVQQG